MDEYKYDLKETVQDIFKCLVYGYLLTIVLMLIREVIVAISAIPPEIIKEIEPILIYLEDSLPYLYLFLRLGKDYGVSIKQCFKRVSIKGRELVALCCFDTGIICVFFLILIIISVAALLLMPSLIDIIANAPFEPDLPAEIFTAVILAPVFEEIICRGILLNIVKPHGTRFAILFTSLIFMLMHSSLGMIPALIGGILMARVALYYNSIYPSILVHFLHNVLLYLSNVVFVVLIFLIPGCFIYFIIKGDYKKYFSIPMIFDADSCWRSVFTPGKIIFILIIRLFSFM